MPDDMHDRRRLTFFERIERDRRVDELLDREDLFCGHGDDRPWERINEIHRLVSRLIEHPPKHPEDRRAAMKARLLEIHRAAGELLDDKPKTKSLRGAVGID